MQTILLSVSTLELSFMALFGHPISKTFWDAPHGQTLFEAFGAGTTQSDQMAKMRLFVIHIV